jgi:hypothetical protein
MVQPPLNPIPIPIDLRVTLWPQFRWGYLGSVTSTSSQTVTSTTAPWTDKKQQKTGDSADRKTCLLGIMSVFSCVFWQNRLPTAAKRCALLVSGKCHTVVPVEELRSGCRPGTSKNTAELIWSEVRPWWACPTIPPNSGCSRPHLMECENPGVNHQCPNIWCITTIASRSVLVITTIASRIINIWQWW